MAGVSVSFFHSASQRGRVEKCGKIAWADGRKYELNPQVAELSMNLSYVYIYFWYLVFNFHVGTQNAKCQAEVVLVYQFPGNITVIFIFF